jgi:hypothetical protein
MSPRDGKSRQSTRVLLLILIGVLSLILLFAWIGFAVNSDAGDFSNVQIGIGLYLQAGGAFVAGIGLLMLLLEAFTGRRVRELLVFTLVLAAGLAMYGGSVWAVFGMVAAAGLNVLHGTLAARSGPSETPTER